ncbi:MAG: glycosyltransferase family 4 protein, partial [Flavobacteriales bacterium]
GKIHTPVRRFGVHDLLVRMAYRKAFNSLSPRFRFRVAHIHVRTPITENIPHLAAKEHLPVVVTEHSSFYHRGIALKSKSEQEKETDRITRWFAHPSIRKVLPVSWDLGDILNTRFGIPWDKLQVIPNVAAAEFLSGPIPVKPPFRIVLAARWSDPKDPSLFIEALHLLPKELRSSLSIHWVGDGDQMEKVRSACASFIAEGIMTFPGRLPKSELAPLLAQAHLLVHPTKAENLPCIIIESLCCGTPVLSNAVNGIPELVDDTNGRLAPPNDPITFANTLRWIMENYPHFDRVAIAKAAVERYSAEAVAKQITAVYDQFS